MRVDQATLIVEIREEYLGEAFAGLDAERQAAFLNAAGEQFFKADAKRQAEQIAKSLSVNGRVLIRALFDAL